jgi:hypothetical protein
MIIGVLLLSMLSLLRLGLLDPSVSSNDPGWTQTYGGTDDDWGVSITKTSDGGYALAGASCSYSASGLAARADTTNNTYNDGWVVVTIPGDVDGDCVVDILDIVRITSIYMVSKGDRRYVSNADIDGSGLIDILDVVICTSHYKQKWP